MKTTGKDSGEASVFLNRLAHTMVVSGASDVHLAPRERPLFRIDGSLKILPEFGEPCSASFLEKLGYVFASGEVENQLLEKGSLDGAFSGEKEGRFRFNLYKSIPGLCIALRRLEDRFRTLSELGLSESLSEWTDFHDGLILVAGPTGSGKSTSIATLMDMINRTRACHIITIEDPVEYIHFSQKSRVDQRQVGLHTPNFNKALVDALRQDPDVILVGEIRERETIRTAITAAETGHLVFATVHAPDCVGAIQRIASVFPADEQPGILRQLSLNLRGILAQHLIPADGTAARTGPEDHRRPRVLISEVLRVHNAAANIVAKGKFNQLYSCMETGSRHGMQTLEENLVDWVQSNHLTKATAMSFARNPGLLEERLTRHHSAEPSPYGSIRS